MSGVFGKPLTICLAVVLTTLCGCGHAPLRWDMTEKALLGTYVGTSVIDAAQTGKFGDNNHVEANPAVKVFFGERPTFVEMLALKAVIFGAVWAFLNYVPTKHAQRKIYLGLLNAIQLGTVCWNVSNGAGLVLPF